MGRVYVVSVCYGRADRHPVAVARTEDRAREIAEEQVLEAEESLDGWFWGREPRDLRTLGTGDPDAPVLEIWPFELEGERRPGSVLRFTDGVEIDTGGPLRTLALADGWYLVGRGMLLPCADEDEAHDLIAEFRDRRGIE